MSCMSLPSSNRGSCGSPANRPRYCTNTPSSCPNRRPVSYANYSSQSSKSGVGQFDYDESAFSSSYGTKSSGTPFFYRQIPPYLVPSYHSSGGSFDGSEYMYEQDIYGDEDAEEENYEIDQSVDEAIEEMTSGAAGQPSMVEYSKTSEIVYPQFPSIKADTLNDIRRGALSPGPMAATYAGKGLFDMSGMRRSKFEPWVEKNTSWRREIQPIYGPHVDMDESDYDFSDPERRQLGFNPYIHTYEMRKFASPYKDFAPTGTSTPYTCPTPDKKTRDAWKYHTPVGEEEESFWKAASPCSPYGKRSPKHKNLTPFPVADDSATTEGIKHALGEMEFNELSKIKKDLKDFQNARRRLIFDATNIKPRFDSSSEV